MITCFQVSVDGEGEQESCTINCYIIKCNCTNARLHHATMYFDV